MIWKWAGNLHYREPTQLESVLQVLVHLECLKKYTLLTGFENAVLKCGHFYFLPFRFHICGSLAIFEVYQSSKVDHLRCPYNQASLQEEVFQYSENPVFASMLWAKIPSLYDRVLLKRCPIRTASRIMKRRWCLEVHVHCANELSTSELSSEHPCNISWSLIFRKPGSITFQHADFIYFWLKFQFSRGSFFARTEPLEWQLSLAAAFSRAFWKLY